MNKASDDNSMRLTPFSSDDCCGESGGSEEDLITDYLVCEDTGEKQFASSASPLVPTISVTPHSPAGKHYPVLEENLQQLHYMREFILRISQDLGTTTATSRENNRMTASCPSLHEAAASDLDLMSSVNSTPSQTLTLAPTARALRRKRGSGEWEYRNVRVETTTDCDISRRRSWAALEDLSNGRGTIKPEFQKRSENFCSVSLSSMESDVDDPFSESTANLLSSNQVKPRVRQARAPANSSTHSLNEAELQNDFKKVALKREVENRLLNARICSPLQKSVSTPSIIAVRELASAEPLPTEKKSAATLPVSYQLSQFTAESDEDEVIAALLGPGKQAEKRRKRGSIFFRKKKDKLKKVSHQWVSVCYGYSQICDFCNKTLTNKPSVYCDSCAATVHQKNCKDSVGDCKGKMMKPVNKSGFISKNKKGCGSPGGHDDDTLYQESSVSYSDAVPLVQYEFIDQLPLTVKDLETDPALGLILEEPDSWAPTVSKDILKKIKEKEIKRQEHIYEFIMTEKHHCLTLKVMQKIFVEGLQKHLNFGSTVDRMFPRLFDLSEIHLNFLRQLRSKQRKFPVIDCISDVLLEQFSGSYAERLKSVYGEFCSNHRNAVDIYKYYMQNDRRFSEFVKHCQGNPLLKKKGIPECILFVTQRLTKYPLLIEPLIKTSKENQEETDKLTKALQQVKEILTEVDSQVAEKEKEDRKLEIYNKVDPKSVTVFRGVKFKKSDILTSNRKLKFEGVAMLMQGRGKMQVVMVLVLTDILCFLLESNQKYTLFTPDNKAGVVSLQKLLVREKAGQDSRGIYLISSNPNEPEMFELRVHKPKDKKIWIQAIRTAVQECPEEEEDFPRPLQNTDCKKKQIKDIVELLRQKDKEQAQILEEKMALQLKLLSACGVEKLPDKPNYEKLFSDKLDNTKVWRDVLNTVEKVNFLAKTLCSSSTNLSRSVSSVGEHHSASYVSLALPKRAETFGGYDNQPPNNRLPKRNTNSETDATDINYKGGERSAYTLNDAYKDAESLSKDAQSIPEHDFRLAAAQLSDHVYTLSCIISRQMTTIDSLEAELSSIKSHMFDSTRPHYRHNHQLEELRNLQDKLQSEKEVWLKEKEVEMKELEEKRTSLLRLQEQVRAEEADIVQQREQLYRKLETLSNQGIVMSPGMAVAPSPDETAPPCTPPSDPLRRKADSLKWKQLPPNKSTTLPINLISAQNQVKVPSNQVKQQLPLKLASKLGSFGISQVPKSPDSQQMLPLKLSELTSRPVQRLGSASNILSPTHSRTGSSPASMQNIQQPESRSGTKAGRTNTYPKLPEKFRIRSDSKVEDSPESIKSNENISNWSN